MFIPRDYETWGKNVQQKYLPMIFPVALDAWKKWTKHILPNGGEFDGDASRIPWYKYNPKKITQKTNPRKWQPGILDTLVLPLPTRSSQPGFFKGAPRTSKPSNKRGVGLASLMKKV